MRERCIRTAALLMVFIISTNFLSILLTHAINTQDATKSFSVIANGEGDIYPYIFKILLSSEDIQEISRMVFGQAISGEANEILTLTEEQIEAVRNSSALRIGDNETESFIEVEKWYNSEFIYITLTYGAMLHLYLDPATAINVDTALTASTILFGLITAILVSTIGGITVAWVTGAFLFILGMLKIDYSKIFAREHNSDNSLDLWYELTLQNVLQVIGGFTILLTKRYVWWVTLIGAYVLKLRYQSIPRPPQPITYPGGCNVLMK